MFFFSLVTQLQKTNLFGVSLDALVQSDRLRKSQMSEDDEMKMLQQQLLQLDQQQSNESSSTNSNNLRSSAVNLNFDIPTFPRLLCNYLEMEGMNEKGLFISPGLFTELVELRMKFQTCMFLTFRLRSGLIPKLHPIEWIWIITASNLLEYC
jgi:hypothetical protein